MLDIIGSLLNLFKLCQSQGFPEAMILVFQSLELSSLRRTERLIRCCRHHIPDPRAIRIATIDFAIEALCIHITRLQLVVRLMNFFCQLRRFLLQLCSPLRSFAQL
jgi:hypothetical protein